MTLYKLELTACHNQIRQRDILYVSKRLKKVIKTADEIIQREEKEFGDTYKMEYQYERTTNERIPYDRVSVTYINKRDNHVVEERIYGIQSIKTDELLSAGRTLWF